MSSWRAFGEAAHVICLGIWVGAASIAAGTAAVAFPTLKGLNVRLADLPPETAADHFRFAAGAIAQRVFLMGDIVAFACATVAGATLLGLFISRALSPRRPAAIVRALALAIAVASLASLLFVVTPRINLWAAHHLDAARIGKTDLMEEYKRNVDDLHPIATNLYAAEIGGAFIALLAGAWSLAKPWAPGTIRTAPAYPEPALASRRRA